MSTVLKALVAAAALATGVATAQADTITPHGVWDQIDMAGMHDARGR